MKRIISLLLALLFCAALCCGCSRNPTRITLNESTLTLTVGDSVSLTAIPDPPSAKLSTLSWSSSNPAIVTVDNGLVRAKSTGAATVIAEDSNGLTAACNITVTDKSVTSISLSHSSTSIFVGKSFRLTATVQPADATDTALSWSSSNPAVAQVNSEGFVTGVGAGATNIICRSTSGAEASCTVTVKEEPTEAPPTQAPAPTEPKVVIVYPHFRDGYQYDSSDFVFPESSSRKLTRTEIEVTLAAMSGQPISNSFAQDAINEIYARNGFIFKSGPLADYYRSTSWYSEDPNYSINDLSAIERYNVDLLAEYR